MAPSQNPAMKKLSNALAEAEKLADKGLGKMKAFRGTSLKLHEMGTCGLEVYTAMGRAGDTTVTRLATAFLVQRILKRKDQNGNIVINRCNDTGLVHPLVTALMERHEYNQYWFTITEEQAVLADAYNEGEEYLPPGISVRDYFHIAQQSVSPDRITVSSQSRIPSQEMGKPKPQQTTQSAMSRLAGPQGQQSALFHGRLRGVEWNDLYRPARVLPGNLVPGTFLNQPTVSTGMDLNADTTPITMLGQGCAKEARDTINTTRKCIDYFRKRIPDTQDLPENWEDLTKKDMLKLATPFDPVRVNKDELSAYIRNQHNQPREMANALSEWALTNSSDARRFEHWDHMFARIGEEQATNPRPGLWTYPQEASVNELMLLDTRVQRAIIDEAKYKDPGKEGGQVSGLQTHGSSTQRQLFGSSSQPRLPASSSHGSILTGSSSRGHALQTAQPGGWKGREDSQEPDPLVTPTNRRHGPRNLFGPAGQPRPGDNYEDDFDLTFSEDRPSSRGRRKRESQSGASAHGRPAKSPSKGGFRPSRE